MFRFERHRSCALVALLCLAFSTPAMAAPASLVPGVEIPAGDRSYTVHLERIVGDAGAADVLRVDVLIRPLDRARPGAPTGSYVPFLSGDYRLLDGDRVVADGPMEFRLSSAGPAYGFDTPWPAPAMSWSLEFDTRQRADGSDPRSARVTIDPGSVPVVRPEAESFADSTDAPDTRMTVVSNLDPRLSEEYSDVWGYSDGSTYLAILGSTEGTLFIDITDPANPVEVADIAGPNSSWRDIKTYGTYAYIGTEGSGAGEGVQVVDLSDPLNPVLVNTYATNFTTSHNLYIDRDIGELWIIGSDNGCRIIDLTIDPVNLVEVGTFTARYVHDMYARNGLACLSEINNDLQELADWSDPSNITVLSSWNTTGLATHNCWANDAQTLLVTTDEVTGGHAELYDISDPFSPAPLVGEYDPNPSAIVHNAYFDDEDNQRVAISHYALGLKLIDVSQPSNPIVLGEYDTFPSGDAGFDGAWGVYPFDERGLFLVSDISTGLYVIRYEPTGGVVAGTIRDGGDGSAVAGGRVVALQDGAETLVGEDGGYALLAETGPVTLRVSAFGYATRILDVGTMPLGGRIDADLMLDRLPRVALTGTVFATGGGAIEGATVRVDGSTLSVVTAPDGTFAFPDVAIGQQIVTADAFGYSPAESRLVLAAGIGGTADLTLDPAPFADDAESDRGWSLGVGGDTASNGQWTRVDPVGTTSGGNAVQPEDDATAAPGTTAFITQQANPGSTAESNDVDGGVTTLLSPALALEGLGAARLNYERWFAEFGSFGSGTFTAQVSNDNGGSWTTVDTLTSTANRWTGRGVDLGSTAGPLTDATRVRFRVQSSGGFFDQFVVIEGGVDQVEVESGCRTRFNPAAPDGDSDGEADGCDACPADAANDIDGDGLCGDVDNAPFAANVDQADGDGDGVGDVADNCPSVANGDQFDIDRDGLGDRCDADQDGDGVDDALDGDRDGDGVANAGDVCPDVPDAAQLDDDQDGAGDACDADDGIVRGVTVDRDALRWAPEAGADSYNVYRGDLGAPALLQLAACRIGGVPGTSTIDDDLPVPGDGFFYVVARVAGGTEGSLGKRSDGSSRSVNSPCP